MTTEITLSEFTAARWRPLSRTADLLTGDRFPVLGSDPGGTLPIATR